MKYLEVRQSVAGLLIGDNSKAGTILESDSTFLSMALRDISMRCIPLVLLSSWDESKTDVFRRIYSTLDEMDEVYHHFYIRKPNIDISDDADVDIDEELMQAVIFFMCSYLSNKKNTNYMKMAEDAINYYNSNSVDTSQYETE